MRKSQKPATKRTKSREQADAYILYTDGSLRRNAELQQTYGAWAYVLLNKDRTVYHTRAAPVWDTTISRMELQAVIEGLTTILDLAATTDERRSRVVLYADSQYAIKSLLWWIPVWRKNDWKNALGGDIKNRDLMETLSELREKVILTAWHVRAHSGNKYNEQADTLAQSLTRKMERGLLEKPAESDTAIVVTAK